MSNVLKKTPPSLTLDSRYLDRIWFLESKIEKIGMRLEMPAGIISRQERDALANRLNWLKEHVRPHKNAPIAERSLLAMFSGFPSLRLDDDAYRAVAPAYLESLASYPIWAIEKGLRLARSKSGAFAPSAPECARAVQDSVAPFYGEIAKLERIFSAKEVTYPSNEDRKIIVAKYRAIFNKGVTA